MLHVIYRFNAFGNKDMRDKMRQQHRGPGGEGFGRPGGFGGGGFGGGRPGGGGFGGPR